MDTSIDFLHKDFSAENAKNSGAMKKVMGNEKIAHTLRSSSERQKFYSALKENGGSVAKALGELKSAKKISSGKANIIGRELVKNGKRFIYPEKNKAAGQRDRSPYVSPGESFHIQPHNNPPMSRPVTGAQLSQSLIKRNSGLMGSGLIKPSR